MGKLDGGTQNDARGLCTESNMKALHAFKRTEESL